MAKSLLTIVLGLYLLNGMHWIHSAESPQEAGLMQQFIQAIANEDINTVTHLMTQHPYLVNQKFEGNTPLHMAIFANNPQLILQLIDKGADINAEDSEDETPLMTAVRAGKPMLVSILLNAQPSPDLTKTDSLDDTALHMAFKLENPEQAIQIARLLLLAGANLETVNQENKTPLDYAQERHPSEAQELQAILNIRDMFIAVNNDDLKELEEFLNHNPYIVNARDQYGQTPLHIASFRNRKPMVQLLINNDADINAPRASEDTPLHLAAWAGATDVIPILLDNNADLLAKNNEGSIPLHLSIRKGFIEAINMLLEYANQTEQLNAKDLFGRTALHLALLFISNPEYAKEIAIKFLDSGSNLYTLDNAGNTPLKIAGIKHPSIVNELEEAMDRIFLEAINRGDIDKVKSLINNGYTKIYKATQHGTTALQEAQGQGNKELVNLLEELSTDPITSEDLSDLDPSEIISYHNQLWSKKSLFNSALNAMTEDKAKLLNPYTREPLPIEIINQLVAHFNIPVNEYRYLIDLQQRAKALRGTLSMEGYLTEEDPAFQDISKQLEELDQTINNYLTHKGIM